jgi:hypothetical protein
VKLTDDRQAPNQVAGDTAEIAVAHSSTEFIRSDVVGSDGEVSDDDFGIWLTPEVNLCNRGNGLKMSGA